MSWVPSSYGKKSKREKKKEKKEWKILPNPKMSGQVCGQFSFVGIFPYMALQTKLPFENSLSFILVLNLSAILCLHSLAFIIAWSLVSLTRSSFTPKVSMFMASSYYTCWNEGSLTSSGINVSVPYINQKNVSYWSIVVYSGIPIRLLTTPRPKFLWHPQVSYSIHLG